MDEKESIFDLPRRRFVLGADGRDLSVSCHGHRAATALGPAAGPQSQMAQNLVLSWLAGSRVIELKTVQLNDELDIPRPCIDMQTVGFNVEWSQELKLEQSLEEYVKGAMLIEMLTARGDLGMEADFEETVFDMSVGYDLAGISSDRVRAFLDGMRDCSGIVDRLRKEIPPEFAELRDLPFRTRLSDTLTLSTFHGCPSDEIESIVRHLFDEHQLNCVVKFNPTLLGPDRTRELLNDRMGYADIHVPETAFESDTTWVEAQGIVTRLGDRSDDLGLGFGVKFSNTLIVENHRDFFPSTEKQMYLSGAPLHVLAVELVDRFRGAFGGRWPVSFSAGIDRRNFSDALALGLVPVTVCSDWLKAGGYARGKPYFDELARRMSAVDACSRTDFVLKAYGLADAGLDALGDTPRVAECRRALAAGDDLEAAAGPELYAAWVTATELLNTSHYAQATLCDSRYTLGENAKVPKKIGSELELFDCITCDKCVPVCPNDANFTFVLPRADVPVEVASRGAESWTRAVTGAIAVEQKHQIANFADFCNECGNCDVFCPEDGGPYVVKPRFFGRREDWEEMDHLDGFHFEREGAGSEIRGRFSGAAYTLAIDEVGEHYRGSGFDVTLTRKGDIAEVAGAADEIDMTFMHLLRLVRDAVYASDSLAYPALIAER